MNETEKKQYLEKYHRDKEKGVPFFPDIIFKDAVISLLIFGLLVGLAYFIGAPLEPRANPADTSYTPRPEWYFIFLFQLLKYFPGNLEVVGVVVLPTIGLILLFALPLIDRSPRRHFTSRPWVSGATALVIIAIALLSFQAYRETPPPAEATSGDQTALLYTRNCSGCHGSSIVVPEGTNLHRIIAQGKHEGMPAWSADLTSDEIDALAGFILSPGGSNLFAANCGECHQVADLVAGNPLELKNALDLGKDFTPHAEVDIPDWANTLVPDDRNALLNFLVAPDGQRLFAIDCSPCHGQSVGFAGDKAELSKLISDGGMHLEMPPWQGQLDPQELDTLAQYVVDPASEPSAEALFNQNCVACHGDRIPQADDLAQARQIIASGGPHQTMPVWGDVLTAAQLEALVNYTFNASKGTSLEIGQQLYSTNCSPCHGEFGEGGLNPTRPLDIIPPISTSEFLGVRDDFTLRAIISQGQPNNGMSPFGSSSGGHLDDDEIDAIVRFMRSWEDNPPVEFPPEIELQEVTLSGREIYQTVCAQCHGTQGAGGIGPAFNVPDYQSENSDQEIFDSINLGHDATPMISWGEILSSDQIHDVVKVIRSFKLEEPAAVETPPSSAGDGAPTFVKDVLPVFEKYCVICHGELGGWDGSTYSAAMTTGDNAPVIMPGDPENSLLAQKILGTQTQGAKMPPVGSLSDPDVQTILDWIAAGAIEQ